MSQFDPQKYNSPTSDEKDHGLPADIKNIDTAAIVAAETENVLDTREALRVRFVDFFPIKLFASCW
jgi:hypothetical protein